jgi:hypothetical protein
MTKYFLIYPILFLFSCQQQEPEKEVFSLYAKQDINDIVMSVLTYDSLPVNRNVKLDTIRLGKRILTEPFIFHVDSELLKLYVYDADTSQRGKHFVDFSGISELIRFRSPGFFGISDSTYLMFQNDHMAASGLKSTELSDLVLDHPKPGEKCFACIKLSMPLFSKDNSLAYMEMFVPEGEHNGYFLKKINNQWVVVQRIGISIA